MRQSWSLRSTQTSAEFDNGSGEMGNQTAGTADFDAIDRYLAEHQRDWIGELAELCAIPSVSARHEGIDQCAALVARMLEKRGFAVEVSPTGGHPVVLGHAGGGTRARTPLFYHHYDVQPPEPLDLWESPPFRLREPGGAVLARGSKDDKGEVVCRLARLCA